MFIRYNWPGLLWLILIFVITGIPGNYIPRVAGFWEWLGRDKIIHLVIFGIFVYLLLLGFKKQYRFPSLRYHYIGYALFIGIIFGAITETMQKYVFIGRNANIYDFAANFLGCLSGYLIYHIFKTKYNKKIRIFKNKLIF